MNSIRDEISELIINHKVDSFFKAFTKKYNADNIEANREFAKNLNRTFNTDKIIFELACIYDFYNISERELLDDIHNCHLIAIYNEKYSF